MRFESAAFPPTLGAPILPFQPKSTRELFESNVYTGAVDASEERSSYPDCLHFTQVGPHTSCETQKARFKQRKLMHYSTIEKKKEREKEKEGAFRSISGWNNQNMGGRKKNSKHFL
jgi:hypothetical protein